MLNQCFSGSMRKQHPVWPASARRNSWEGRPRAWPADFFHCNRHSTCGGGAANPMQSKTRPFELIGIRVRLLDERMRKASHDRASKDASPFGPGDFSCCNCWVENPLHDPRPIWYASCKKVLSQDEARTTVQCNVAARGGNRLGIHAEWSAAVANVIRRPDGGDSRQANSTPAGVRADDFHPPLVFQGELLSRGR